MKSILIISAIEREQHFLKVAKNKSKVKTAVCGIGPVDAGILTRRLLEDETPDAVWFLGTGGAYRGRYLEPGDVLIGSSVVFGDAAAAAGTGYVPGIQVTAGDLVPVCLDHRFPFKVKNGRILTVPSITRDAETAVRLQAAYSADAENLEAFSVWRACSLAGIPVHAVLGISNLVGPDAHSEWLAWQDTAMEHATEVLEFLTT